MSSVGLETLEMSFSARTPTLRKILEEINALPAYSEERHIAMAAFLMG